MSNIINHRQFNHDMGAELANNAIYNLINSGSWKNIFLKTDLVKTKIKATKPVPDGRFYSYETSCHVAIEYKPPYSSLDEVGKGFSQCTDYIVDRNNRGDFLNQASILVVPDINENGNQIESIYETKFKDTVYNKNNIALVTYSENNPSNIRVVVDFGSGIQIPDQKPSYAKNDEVTYWAAWRENYPSFNYYLLKTAQKHRGNYDSYSVDKIWNDFYYSYYCYPPETTETLDLIPNKLNVWGNERNIWQRNTKRVLKKGVEDGLITHDEAIYRLKWASASTTEDRKKFGFHIKNISIKAPEKISTDNDYLDIKKNRRNFLNHIGLFDNLTWEVTELGDTFLNRIQQGADPEEEMVALMLTSGRWYELIKDIKRYQEIIKNDHSNVNDFRKQLKTSFKMNGSIGINPGRAVSNARKFLHSEQQVLGRFKLLKKFGNAYYKESYGYQFDDAIINKYLNIYYKYYCENDLAA
jgi:hypothetical protein